MNEQQIRERLAKIKALFAGATTPGERQAAQAAMERMQTRLDLGGNAAPVAGNEAVIEYRFSLTNAWALRLFLALCRSKGLKPYRHPRMRRTSVCVRLTRTQVDRDLWPEFQEMNAVLSQYLSELADHIIADCIDPDRSDAEVVAGLPGPTAGPEMSE
jgi:hypothetical protein